MSTASETSGARAGAQRGSGEQCADGRLFRTLPGETDADVNRLNAVAVARGFGSQKNGAIEAAGEEDCCFHRVIG